MKILTLMVLASALLLLAAPAQAEYPTSGMPVAELSFLDDIVQAYMDTTDATGVVVGLSVDDRIVFRRGYGWSDEALVVEMQENAAFRVASVNKTLTAAIIRDLVDRGMLSLGSLAFDVGQPGGGILNLAPFPTLVDDGFGIITIEDLLLHRAGWDRRVEPDPTARELVIQSDMGLSELPTAEETMRWALGQELQFEAHPDSSVYANIGYLALNLIAEQISGTDGLSYLRTFLLTDELWFPANDLLMGRTFAIDQDPREPHYNSPFQVTNVFDPTGPNVWAPYGGRNHEQKDGYGRLVATTTPLLRLAHRFYLNGNGRGEPISDVHQSSEHGGALHGTSAVLRQLDTGVDFVIMVNSWRGERHYAKEIRAHFMDALPAVMPWLTETVDCTWFDFAYNGDELGSYELPFGDFTDLGKVPPYSKVKIKSSSSSWTGVIDRGHLALFTTENGSVVIGR